MPDRDDPVPSHVRPRRSMRLELAHRPASSHQRDRDVEHPLERLDADALVGLVVALGPVGEVRARETRRLERVRVRRAAGDDVARLVPAGAQRLLGERHLRPPWDACGSPRTSARRSRRGRTRGRWRRPGGGRPSRSRPPPRDAASRLRASASSVQRSGTTLIALPPAIVPTFAVVSGSRRPEPHRRDRGRRGGDRAASVLGADARRARRARAPRRTPGSAWARRARSRRSAWRGRTRSRSCC